MKKVGVYAIINKINNKLYIGRSLNITYRWYAHKSDLNCNKHHSFHLQNAYNKYGKENFEYKILELTNNEEDLYKLENKYLKFYKSYNRKYGYNIVLESNKFSKETRKKMSNGHKSSIHKKVALNNLKLALKITTKPILQFTLNGEFIKKWKSAREAAEILNIKRHSINRVCTRKRVTYKNFIWRYENDSSILDRIDLTRTKIISINNKGNEVEYKSINEASRITGYPHFQISNYLRGKMKNKTNLNWKYK